MGQPRADLEDGKAQGGLGRWESSGEARREGWPMEDWEDRAAHGVLVRHYSPGGTGKTLQPRWG